MAAIGKNHPLILLIHKKTKVKIVDIVDVLGAISECVPQAFFEANLEARKPFNIGGIFLFWKPTKNTGSSIVIKPSTALRKEIIRLKLEKRTPFAIKLYNLIPPYIKIKAEKAQKIA